MIALIDYGVGNLFSLKSSLSAVGAEAIVTSDLSAIKRADKLILPGVGAFGDAALKLREGGLAETVVSEVSRGKPILGICLGMQLLFERSYEYGEYDGLGLLDGEIRPIADVIPGEYKIPHIGWNSLRFKKECKLFKYIDDGDFVYFVHSFYATCCGDALAAVTEYGAELTAAVAKDNLFGCQFHPEKSGDVGLRILKSFCEDMAL